MSVTIETTIHCDSCACWDDRSSVINGTTRESRSRVAKLGWRVVRADGGRLRDLCPDCAAERAAAKATA